MKTIKQIRFNSKEVERPIGIAKEFKLECTIGGFYTNWIEKKSNGFTLYCGSGIGSEPCFRIQHTFKTRYEAVLYAQVLWNSFE